MMKAAAWALNKGGNNCRLFKGEFCFARKKSSIPKRCFPKLTEKGENPRTMITVEDLGIAKIAMPVQPENLTMYIVCT